MGQFFQSIRRFIIAALLVMSHQVSTTGARIPGSAESMYRDAELVVRGEIIDFKIGTVEHSEGSDWAISAKVAVDEVIKGGFHGDVLHAKCFRPRTRAGMTWGCASPRIPVPEVGIPMVVFLTVRDEQYHVIPPNGFQSLEDAEITIAKVNAGQAAEDDENGGQRDGEESNASVVGDLPSNGSPGFLTAAVVDGLEFQGIQATDEPHNLVLSGLVGVAVGLLVYLTMLLQSSRLARRNKGFGPL